MCGTESGILQDVFICRSGNLFSGGTGPCKKHDENHTYEYISLLSCIHLIHFLKLFFSVKYVFVGQPFAE